MLNVVPLVPLSRVLTPRAFSTAVLAWLDQPSAAPELQAIGRVIQTTTAECDARAFEERLTHLAAADDAHAEGARALLDLWRSARAGLLD